MFVAVTASTHPVTHVAFEPGGASYAVTQPNHGVTLLERGTNRVLGAMAIPRVADYSALLFGGGSRLVASSIRGVHLIDATGRGLLRYYRGGSHAGAFLAEREGEFLAATRGAVRKLHPPEGAGLFGTSTPIGLDLFLARTHAISPDGRWLVARLSAADVPSLIDLAAGAAVAALHHAAPEHDRVRLSATFSPDGCRLAVCDGQDVSVYDLGELDSPEPPVQRSGGRAVAPQPRVVLSPVFRLPRPSGVNPKDFWRPPVAFTPDGRGLLVRRPRNRVQLWDLGTGSHAGEWGWRLDGVLCLAVAPDGLTAAAGARFGRVVVWDLE